jgi:hypothetical protein
VTFLPQRVHTILGRDVIRPRIGAQDRTVERKAKLLTRATAGIVFNEHTDEDGATVFRHA